MQSLRAMATLGRTLAFVGVAASAMAIVVNFARLFRVPDLKVASAPVRPSQHALR